MSNLAPPLTAAQAGPLPIALLVGRKADAWGRKPLFLAKFAILPVRAVLYTLSDNSVCLIGVQAFDGVFRALALLMVVEIMRGTGRYNLAQRAIATMVGIRALLSGLATGEIVDRLDNNFAFLTLAAASMFAFAMPETTDSAI